MSAWLSRALDLSRARGFLGPQPIEVQFTHAEGFAHIWDRVGVGIPRNTLDLGSGGGVPGLALLDIWHSPVTMLDAMEKRTTFLREVLLWDDSPTGGEVITGRAEDVARNPQYLENFELVVARSFAPPAVVAECASRFLEMEGFLIVSEPPEETSSRWNQGVLEHLGLTDVGLFRSTANFRVIKKIAPTPEEFPRSTGIPGKRPLF